MMKRLIALLLAALMLASLALAEDSEPVAEESAPIPAPVEEEPVPAPAPAAEEPTPVDEEPSPASDPIDEHADEPGYKSLEELSGAGEYASPVTMYVYTDNGGTLSVHSEPFIRNGNVIGKLQYGASVTVVGSVVIDPSWLVIRYSKGPEGLGYVQGRYLVSSKPAPRNNDKKSSEEKKKDQDVAELNRQLKSFRTLDTAKLIAVRTTRTSGWINFRVGPGVASERISSLPDGTQLKAIGETDKWWQAIELNSGKIGYISKNYTVVIGVVVDTPAAAAPAAPVKESLGTLSVNGEFALQCLLPETYVLQVVNVQGSKIVASILSEDIEKPELYLTIAYSEIFSDVERMNDLSEDDLQMLETSFTDMNDVEISYTETSYGTKLMVCREVGNDTDFVDIFSVYKGYNVEFIMQPNPKAKNQHLTDAQIKMCVDFLSEVDFISPDEIQSQTEAKPIVHHQRIIVGK